MRCGGTALGGYASARYASVVVNSLKIPRESIELARSGRLRPVAGAMDSFVESAAAHAAIEARGPIGKTVLVPLRWLANAGLRLLETVPEAQRLKRPSRGINGAVPRP